MTYTDFQWVIETAAQNIPNLFSAPCTVDIPDVYKRQAYGRFAIQDGYCRLVILWRCGDGVGGVCRVGCILRRIRVKRRSECQRANRQPREARA